jgi:hypothetical protein
MKRNVEEFIPPTVEEVEAYCKEEGYYDVNAEKFWNHYEDRHWCRGKPTKQFPYGTPMSNWHCSVALWTHTTKTSRLMHKTKTCACGCGRKPMMLVDGKCYAMEKCITRANKKLFQEPEIVENNSKKDLASQEEQNRIFRESEIKRREMKNLTQNLLKKDNAPVRNFQAMKLALLRGEK